jgi:hypothetical protein
MALADNQAYNSKSAGLRFRKLHRQCISQIKSVAQAIPNHQILHSSSLVMPTRNTLNVIEFIQILNTLASCGQAKQLQPSEEFHILAGRAAISTDNLGQQVVLKGYQGS